jgi:alkylation response protein AidB-like acyl-CoA dehydrogenase
VLNLSLTLDDRPDLASVLYAVSRTADERDRAPYPVFPEQAIRLLEQAGVLAHGANVGADRPPAASELELVRAVARADGSVGRIVDGHINATERLAVQAPAELADSELELVRAGRLRLGVWGGDPVTGEGTPAALSCDGAGEVLNGVKTFCSGAGGLDRALVLARDKAGPPVAVWIDLNDEAHVQIDRSWYSGSGLRASESHRVVFDNAPVIARFGPPGALAMQPWFGRDALRTAASWAGMADCAAEHALMALAARPARGVIEELAAGRILNEMATIDAWIDVAAAAMDRDTDGIAGVSLNARAAIAAACRRLLDEAARACGSQAFVRGGGLDRPRRDLELFLLQHRLDPMLARAGAAVLDEPAHARAETETNPRLELVSFMDGKEMLQ